MHDGTGDDRDITTTLQVLYPLPSDAMTWVDVFWTLRTEAPIKSGKIWENLR